MIKAKSRSGWSFEISSGVSLATFIGTGGKGTLVFKCL